MNTDKPIEKRNVTEGPADMKQESTTKLNRKSDGKLEQVEVNKPAACPTCGLPIDDFQEEFYGKCVVPGCETILCKRCGAIPECGFPVCREHVRLVPDQNPDHESSTIVACPQHAPVIGKSQNLIKLAALWKKKRELDARKKEIKAKQVRALVPLYVKWMEGKIDQRRLRFKAYEVQKREEIERLNADIKRELNKIKVEQIRSHERIERGKIEAQLKETARKREESLYRINLLQKKEERKREELAHQKHKDRARLKLAEGELKRKKNKDRSQIQLAREKLTAAKEQAKRKTREEVMDIIRKHTENMEEISVEKSKEKRKTARLAHDIDRENKKLKLEEEKMRSVRELAEKELSIKVADVKRKVMETVGDLELKNKAESRKSKALEYEKRKDAFQLMLEGKKVQLNADELALEKEKADKEFKKALLKLDLQERIHDQDLRAKLEKQAQERENEKAKRMLEAAELVRKENKDLRDYYLRVERLNRARKKLYSL